MQIFGARRVSAPVTVRARGANRGRETTRGELLARYGAAYACTLISVVATQLYVANALVAGLASLTIAGMPISLWLRAHESGGVFRIGPLRVSRFVLNSFVVLLSIAGTVLLALPYIGKIIDGGSLLQSLLSFDARGVVALLMESFLVFGVVRGLAITTDKDAVLSALPSFSVLLLMVVVQQGDPAVVLYFLMWMIAASTLFALDHRAEARQSVQGFLPSIVPGQDVKLSFRGLASLLGVSLACAIFLSWLLSSQTAQDKSNGDNFLVAIAARLNALTLNMNDPALGSGIEQQIDFVSGPVLPTRRPLWLVSAERLEADGTHRAISPSRWRMFTLGNYDGKTWTPTPSLKTAELQREMLISRPQRELVERAFDAPALPPRLGTGRRVRSGPTSEVHLREGRGEGRDDGDGRYRQRLFGGYEWRSGPPRLQPWPGYDVGRDGPDRGRAGSAFGPSRSVVRQSVQALVPNVDYLPHLPSARLLILPDSLNASVRARADYALSFGVLQPGQRAEVVSRVAGADYGGASTEHPPALKIAKPLNPDARLSEAEARQYLALPISLPERVRLFARAAVRGAPKNSSNFALAHRLASAVQNNATYTLRPSSLPLNRDATDYFLFDSRRGYCTYFASALAVLCRTEGIPSRVVTGFASDGAPDDSGHIVLIEAQAHAWTEIWTPGWGWAPVDATPSDDRGNNARGLWQNGLDILGATLERTRNWLHASGWWLLVPATALLMALIGWLLSRGDSAAWGMFRRRKRVLNEDELSRRQLLRAYERAARQIARRFRRRASWETPHEWLQAAQHTNAFPDDLARQHFATLTNLYTRVVYSPAPLSSLEAATMQDALT